MSQVEEGEQVDDTRRVGGLEGAEEKAQSHHALPVLRGRLECRDETPAEDDGGADKVRRQDFPEEQGEFEDDVGDVEDCEEPFVAVADEVEGRFHAGDFGVADVAAVEEGEHVFWCSDD